VAGERGELARVSRLVEGEQDQGQARLVAEPVEQRLEAADVVGRDRDVGALVAAEPGEHGGVVVAQRPGMELHDQAVVEAHPRHLDQHLAAEPLSLRSRQPAGECPDEQRLTLAGRQVERCGRGMAVIGRGRASEAKNRRRIASARRLARPARGLSSPVSAPSWRRRRRTRGTRGRRRDRAGRSARSGRASPRRAASGGWRSGSSGDSVVDSTSIRNRSNSARGRSSGRRSASAIRS